MRSLFWIILLTFTGGLASAAPGNSTVNSTSLPVDSMQIGTKSTKVFISMTDIGNLVQSYGMPTKTYGLNALLENAENTALYVTLAPSPQRIQDPNFGCKNVVNLASRSGGKFCILEIPHQIGNESDPAPPYAVPAPTAFSFSFDTGRAAQNPIPQAPPAPAP